MRIPRPERSPLDPPRGGSIPSQGGLGDRLNLFERRRSPVERARNQPLPTPHVMEIILGGVPDYTGGVPSRLDILYRTKQELPRGEDEPPKTDMLSGIPEHDGHGYLIIPDRPGIGIELKPDAVEKAPPRPWGEVVSQLNADGSIAHQ